MNELEFEEWKHDVKASLFSVSPTDLTDDHLIRVDEWTVLQWIIAYPKVLQHKNLKELIELFIKY